MAREAILNSIWQVLFSFIPWLRRPLSPDRIVRTLAREAKRQARSWGADNKREIPNRFVVRVTGDDWDSYYRSRAGVIEDRIGVLLLRRFADSDYTMVGKPEIELLLDADLEWRPMRVEAIFAEPAMDDRSFAGKASYAVCDRCVTAAAEIEQKEPFTQKMDRSESECRDGLAGFDPKETLALSDVVKTLVMRGGASSANLVGNHVSHHVEDGFRVGADRGDGDVVPEIILTGLGCEFISREHGVFHHRCGEWGYSNLGSNGTTVEHVGGLVENLGKGDVCALNDGDVLFFATDIPYKFSECVKR